MRIGDILTKTFTNMDIVSSITSTVFIILLGFYCRKREIFTDKFGKILSKVVLTVALPALAFNSFMQDINGKTLKEGINVLVWGFLIYIILILISKPLYLRFKGDQQDTLRVLTIFGSTTFFGIPIVGAVFGAKGVMYSSIFNIGYRVFLYSYGYIKMSGLKMESKNLKNMFLNPIVIATFAGLIIWLIQGALPQVAVAGHSVAFLRIDQTAPWLFKPMTYLAGLCSPLAWLAIGTTLGEISFKEAASDKTSWIYSINKVILVPALNILLLAILTMTHILPVSYISLATIVIMMATPTATVAAAYAISFDKDAVLASNASLLSTVLAVVMTPVWLVILEVINQIGIF
ncbi:AEC family transporter [Latilactobacillus curvatus]|uniref:AEC family transporter n=1 Tax=Latilactobacillus curvatus TaxID=28038 RepID=UPI0020C74B09|nr:AEC family transporter [Latilactobacillus curvatus]MCP8848498.1 AEC family transporter [Latilactobacillus curvatus]MCP8865114.1 AEC family transporter [Latilactobacillus curvatus]MCP8873962.1 AEC family transporter [Latilactobacillus curvatus]MCP8875756.1 AEC family transporter [Latilactobacillus curvatus]MCP8879349.1 AEC family transporter [Latilactobacillus curvatus]